MPARDWADVGRALALGCLLGLVVAVTGCSDVTLSGELVGAIVLLYVVGFCAAAAAGVSHGERLVTRRLMRELEEEGKAIPSLWKGARR